VFLEISPHPVLIAAVEKNLGESEQVLAMLPSLQRGKPSLAALDDSLGGLYVAGHNPDWAARYPNGRVVSTPTYCWQRERAWLDVPELARPTPIHPLLGTSVASDDPNTLVWEQTIDGEVTAYFADHCLQGLASVSTSGMVEMMVAAASQTLGTETLELVDLELRRALLLPQGRAYRVQTLLKRGRNWTAEVRGRAEGTGGPWRTHAIACVRPASSTPPVAPEFDRPLASRLSRDAAYRELASLGLQYGPTFRGIEWLSRDGEGVLASVRMPAGLDAQPYFFHPALHDAALHGTVLSETCQGHSGVLPVRIQRIWIHARPGDALLTHARVTPVERGMRADVRVENVGGEVVEIVEGIELTHLDDAIFADEPVAEEASWLYGVEWAALSQPVQPPQSRAQRDGGRSRVWLILADRHGVGETLASRMRASGLETVVVTLEAIARAGGSEEARQEEIARALSLRPGVSLAGAVHLFGIDLPDVESISPEGLDETVADSCDSALALMRALEEAFPASATPVWFVTRGGQPFGIDAPQMAPLQAPLWGLARSIAEELPARWGGLVDLDPRRSPGESADHLWAWLRGSRHGEDEVLFRGGEILCGRLVRRAVPEAPTALSLRPDASYLITGGTGGLGLAVARWLASRGAKHLVLAARTPLPPRSTWEIAAEGSSTMEAVRAVQAIEALGATVYPVSLDVADHRAFTDAIEEHEREGNPPIRGVLHLAGTVHIADLLRIGTSGLLEAVRPKLHGTVAIHRWMEDLDFLVLFSSASSVIRSPRLAPYAAANAFLDAMAHYRRARGEVAIAIDWGLWSEIGFIRQLGERGPGALQEMKSISPDAGLRILERLLQSGETQTIVWPPDWDKWAERYPSFARTSFIAHLVKPKDPESEGESRRSVRAIWTDTPEAERSSVLRDHVAREIAAQLKLPLSDLPLDTPLEQLGFDSLQATELQARLLQDLGVRIPLLRFLGFSSVDSIVNEVRQCLASEDSAPDLTLADLEPDPTAYRRAPAFHSEVVPVARDVVGLASGEDD
jgi:acyl transferase domain-containing protein/acyl carrier protein